MRKIERRLRERLKDLQQQLDKKNDEIYALEEDRKKFREWFMRRFKWWVKLLGEQKTPSTSFLVEEDAKFLHTVKWFHWG